MSDIFKKLNTLIKASLSDALSGESHERSAVDRPRRVDPAKLGSQLDREVENLRGKVNEAIAYEDKLKAKIATIQEEIHGLDQRADQAVLDGDDVNARYWVEQMKRAQQRAEFAEADLREHRHVTHELIERVNVLEAYVAEAKRRQQEQGGGTPTDTTTAADINVPLQRLTEVLRSARETIAGLAGEPSADTTPTSSSPSEPVPPTSKPDPAVDDDLERRRQRLSKP